MDLYNHLISTFIVLWAVIDPIGTVPIYLAVTHKYSDQDKAMIAKRAVFLALVVLLSFIAIGELLLKHLGVPLQVFQISGGIILFLFAISMIFGESKPEEELRILKSGHETAVFPLAIPSIAGPGSIMAVMILTDKTRFSIENQFMTVGVLVLVLFCQWILLRNSRILHKYLGESGISVISRIMGLILAAIASSNVLAGIKIYFAL